MRDDHHSQPIIGEAPAFIDALEHVSRVAPLTKPVLVIGERGTGKELIAARLHYLSRRWDQPLVKVNCAALTESILESELFGHEAGAFTGAVKAHRGHFERADGGTLVLDELATISLRMQEKILRVIEYGELQRVGGTETLRVDVRIVGSTNADLRGLVAEGRFRDDLLDRLAFDVITIPPLRERPEDILPLATAFAMNMVSELGRPVFGGFTNRASSALLQHDWPGNVRELKNAVERSVYRAEDPDEPVDEIAFDPFDSPWQPRSRPPDSARTGAPLREGHDLPGPRVNRESSSSDEAPLVPTELNEVLAEMEVRYLQAALNKARFNQKVAAGLLGLTYHQLRARIRKYGVAIEPADSPQDSSR